MLVTRLKGDFHQKWAWTSKTCLRLGDNLLKVQARATNEPVSDIFTQQTHRWKNRRQSRASHRDSIKMLNAKRWSILGLHSHSTFWHIAIKNVTAENFWTMGLAAKNQLLLCGLQNSCLEIAMEDA